jgi:hypothetical protein
MIIELLMGCFLDFIPYFQKLETVLITLRKWFWLKTIIGAGGFNQFMQSEANISSTILASGYLSFIVLQHNQLPIKLQSIPGALQPLIILAPWIISLHFFTLASMHLKRQKIDSAVYVSQCIGSIAYPSRMSNG